MTRINAVPGEGPEDAKIMLIGEAPGKKEDETGRPFIGRAGALLGRALNEASLSREEVFITNVVKCRPPDNRKPKAKEIKACRTYLLEQIDIVRPSIIVTLGLTALQSFKDTKRMQESSFEWVYRDKKIKIFPTYHPAAALRGSKLAKHSLFRTMKEVKRFMKQQNHHIDENSL